MTVKRPYVTRQITFLAVAAMVAVAVSAVWWATAQNQASPSRHQLGVEGTARQVSTAGASAAGIAITPNGSTAYVITPGDAVILSRHFDMLTFGVNYRF